MTPTTRDDLERRAQRLAHLVRAQQMLTQLASEDNLPRAIAEAVCHVLPAASCDVLAVQQDALVPVVRLERGVLSPPHLPDAGEPTALALARATVDSLLPALQFHEDGTCELCAPVRVGRGSAGVIRLVARPGEQYDSHDLDLITILARHAGTAAETARLFALQRLQRRRAEAAAELARITLQAVHLAEGAAELLAVLDRVVPSNGKALGVSRSRDGALEYVAASGTLEVLRGRRTAREGIERLATGARARETATLRDVVAEADLAHLADEWTLVVPLIARQHTLGVLLVSTPLTAPLPRRDRLTLRRLGLSVALSLDALLLDEEERLAREREHLLATALTTIDHPIFILDRSGIRYANLAAAREYGFTQAELMEMRLEALVVGHDEREGAAVATGLVQPGVRVSHDVHRRRDGSEFPAAVTISTLYDHSGGELGRVVSVRNVTQDRHVEEQLRHTEKMVALGELVAGVAHEINNPLTGISAFAQILMEDALTADQMESVQLIKQEADRAKIVIRDLLLFARKTEPGAGPIDVNALLEQSVRLRAYPLRVAGVEVSLDLDPTSPRVSGDAQKLQQVLLNVISNAEHAVQGCEVRRLALTTRVVNDEVRITATDSGVGMSPDVRRRIFEPFFTTKPAGVGTGLGLSVSYGIISAHGGTIRVESEPDAGTTLTIVLPALRA